MLYYYLRIFIVRFQFLEKIREGIKHGIRSLDDPILKETYDSNMMLTSIHRSFTISRPGGIENQSVFHKLIVYLGGLYHCCFSALLDDRDYLDKHIPVHLEAIKMIPKGPPYLDMLGRYRDEPADAIQGLEDYFGHDVTV